MNVTSFLMMLTGFSVLNGLVVEGIKKIFDDKVNFVYNILALITSLIIGVGGSLIYYQLNGIGFSANNIIYAVLMGLASGLVSMVGYDKVSQAVNEIYHY